MRNDNPGIDETQAVALLKRGDLTGLEMLVRAYQVRAVYAAYLIVHDQQLAEDVVQTTFIKAIDKISQFDGSRSFGPWFLRSVINAAIDAAKRQARWLPLEDEPGETFVSHDWLSDDVSWLDDLVETNETRNAVRKALNQLSPEQRATIVLRYFLEMSEADMTDFLHRPPSTVKWWLHTARQRLRHLMLPIRTALCGESNKEVSND